MISEIILSNDNANMASNNTPKCILRKHMHAVQKKELCKMTL